MILCFRFSLHFRAANRFRNLLSSNGMVLLLDEEVSFSSDPSFDSSLSSLSIASTSTICANVEEVELFKIISSIVVVVVVFVFMLVFLLLLQLLILKLRLLLRVVGFVLLLLLLHDELLDLKFKGLLLSAMFPLLSVDDIVDNDDEVDESSKDELDFSLALSAFLNADFAFIVVGSSDEVVSITIVAIMLE